jgi:hypothetical protein
VIDPRGLTVQQWTSAVSLTLATAAPPMKLTDEDWQRWAVTLIQDPKIATYTPPDPRGFSDWRSWAERFVQAVPL